MKGYFFRLKNDHTQFLAVSRKRERPSTVDDLQYIAFWSEPEAVDDFQYIAFWSEPEAALRYLEQERGNLNAEDWELCQGALRLVYGAF